MGQAGLGGFGVGVDLGRTGLELLQLPPQGGLPPLQVRFLPLGALNAALGEQDGVFKFPQLFLRGLALIGGGCCLPLGVGQLPGPLGGVLGQLRPPALQLLQLVGPAEDARALHGGAAGHRAAGI